MTQKRTAVPQVPVSLPLLFPPVFAAVFLLHITLLRLPYFWDEGGYYIPAAWDFFRLGTLIPETTMRNAHPPLPSILLAGWWRLTGFSVFSTRLFMCLVTTAALLAVFRLARTWLGNGAALAVMLLSAIYPVWFAQSTLAHADMFAAAFSLAALSFYAAGTRPGESPSKSDTVSRAISAAMLFALAVLSKETAIVLPAALWLLEAFLLLRERANRRDHMRWMVALTLPAIVLGCWYAYHRAKTGFAFGNPEFLRYNATANLSAARIGLSLWHRLVHLTVHMNLFIPAVLTCVVMAFPARDRAAFLPRAALRMIGVLLLAQWIFFSVLGGALLTRYLLPAYPLLLIVYVSAWQSRLRRWPAFAALSLLGFAIGCRVNPPYAYAPEDNLGYRDMIVVQQHAINVVAKRYPRATVLTAWPVLADLQRPELGYVRQPMRTVQIENFSAPEIARAAASPGGYDTAILFSTKYDPHGGLRFPANRMADERFYDFHHDLLPDQAAHALGGAVVWQEERNGEWAAVLTFAREVVPPGTPVQSR